MSYKLIQIFVQIGGGFVKNALVFRGKYGQIDVRGVSGNFNFPMLELPHMDILGKLFSSNAIVKIMRLFLLNPETPFENKDISSRSKVSASSLRTEMSILHGVKFVSKKVFYKEVASAAKNGKVRRKKVSGWILNKEFPHLYALKLLLLNPDSVNKKNIAKRLSAAGRIKLVVLSGIFLMEDASRIDILVVGDNVSKKSVESAIKHIESEVGKEVGYAAMDTKEFNYRLSMYDKFIRDILDYPHEKIVNKLGL